jgi:hypothetical protein
VCCFSAVRDLLNKTGVSPKQVGVVITNCSLFNPTPSLSATIINHFGMGGRTINYNLGGMGCSGALGVALGGGGGGRRGDHGAAAVHGFGPWEWPSVFLCKRPSSGFEGPAF